MKALVNYLWNKPEERAVISEVIDKLVTNPLGGKLEAFLAKAYKLRDEFNRVADKNKGLLEFRTGLVDIYERLLTLRRGLSENDPAITTINSTIDTLENLSKEIHAQTRFTYLPLAELAAMKQF